MVKLKSNRRRMMTRRGFVSLTGMASAGLALTGTGYSGNLLKQVPTEKKYKVALAKAGNYNKEILRSKIRKMFDEIGGLGDIIKPGYRVAIKVNLTGGLTYSGDLVQNGTNAHWTHPEIVRTVCEALKDAGAGELYIMDGLFGDTTYKAAGYNEIAEYLGARLIDLNFPAPYKDFIHKRTGKNWYIYEDFVFNPLISDVDAFVSIPKMKCHNNCGVTLSMKNHIGLVPVSHYHLESSPGNRSALHGTDSEARTRLPKVIMDLVSARPIDLIVIDGIKTAEGGEGPWIRNTFGLVEPGTLVAGKNPVATDAIATATMGFDPGADDFTVPFVNSVNHLNLAREKGLGTNRLDEIEVMGVNLQDTIYRFKPCS
jgi:uncharacterized protein (DUF362 family)